MWEVGLMECRTLFDYHLENTVTHEANVKWTNDVCWYKTFFANSWWLLWFPFKNTDALICNKTPHFRNATVTTRLVSQMQYLNSTSSLLKESAEPLHLCKEMRKGRWHDDLGLLDYINYSRPVHLLESISDMKWFRHRDKFIRNTFLSSPETDSYVVRAM